MRRRKRRKRWADLDDADKEDLTERVIDVIERFSPPDAGIVVIVVGEDGETLHCSPFDPLKEAIGLRDLADQIEAEAIGRN